MKKEYSDKKKTMDNYNNTRISMDLSPMDIFIKMSDGNPGGLSALLQMYEHGALIDPMDFMGEFGAMFALDSHGIYGSRIWMLYKDVCDENIGKTIAILRATQLGFLSDSDLDTGIDNYGAGIDVNSLVAQVEARLPNFNVNARYTKDMNDAQ